MTAVFVSSLMIFSTSTRVATYRLPRGLLLEVTTRTKSPFESLRMALLGTMVSYWALFCPTDRFSVVPASTSPVMSKVRILFVWGFWGSVRILDSVALISPP